MDVHVIAARDHCTRLLQIVANYGFHDGRYISFINGATRGRGWVEYMKARQAGFRFEQKNNNKVWGMSVAFFVIRGISRQLGSDSCLLKIAIEIPGFTTKDYGHMVSKSTQKIGKMWSKSRKINRNPNPCLLS